MPERLALEPRLLYRDGLMLVLDKPAGLPVHAGPGGGATLEPLLEQLRFGLPRPPALAHRLDRDTSGCLVLGRHRKALARLGRLFAEGRVDKLYWALVEGDPPEAEGRIEIPLDTSERAGRVTARPDPAGRPAVTTYRVLARGRGVAWLELRPLTGRTHQLRVHCAALGCPIVGDRRYGAEEVATGQQLHARRVVVPLYPGKPSIEAVAPPPAHLRERFAAAGIDLEREAAGPAGATARQAAPA